MSRYSYAAMAAAVALGGLTLTSVGASAMPMVDVSPAVVAQSGATSGITDVRWHGGWHRHGWHRPWGWHRGWHRHHWR